MMDKDERRILAGVGRRLDAAGRFAPSSWHREPESAGGVRGGSNSPGALSLAASALLIIVFVVGTAALARHDSGARSSLEVPTWDRPAAGLAVCNTASLEAVLRGSPGDVRVFWLESGDQRIDVRWPPGFTARTGEVLELVSGDGSVIARAGDLVAVGGGFGPSDDAFGICMINGQTYPSTSPTQFPL